MQIQIIGVIGNKTTDAEKLSVLNYLKDNFALKINQVTLSKKTDTCRFIILENVYNDAVTALTNIKTQFGDDLIDWQFNFKDV